MQHHSSFESYRIHSIKRRGVYYIFCDSRSSAALFRWRRYFDGGVISMAALFRWRRLIKIQFISCKQLYGDSAFNRINTVHHLCIWGWGYPKTWKGVAKNEPTYAALYQRDHPSQHTGHRTILHPFPSFWWVRFISLKICWKYLVASKSIVSFRLIKIDRKPSLTINPSSYLLILKKCRIKSQ